MKKFPVALCMVLLVVTGCGKSKGPARVLELLDPSSGAASGADQAIKELDALFRENPAAVADLVPAMKHRNAAIRRDAVVAVPDSTSNAVVTAALIQATMDPEAPVRASASVKLAHLPPEVQAEASAALIARLSSASEDERASAAAALRPIRSKDLVDKAVPALTKALADSGAGVRYHAAHSLTALDPEHAAPAVPALIGALGPPVLDPDDRFKAAKDLHTLARHCADRVPDLARGLEDSAPLVRIELLEALAALGPAAKGARAAIEKCVADSDENVQSTAKRALSALGN